MSNETGVFKTCKYGQGSKRSQIKMINKLKEQPGTLILFLKTQY